MFMCYYVRVYSDVLCHCVVVKIWLMLLLLLPFLATLHHVPIDAVLSLSLSLSLSPSFSLSPHTVFCFFLPWGEMFIEVTSGKNYLWSEYTVYCLEKAGSKNL